MRDAACVCYCCGNARNCINGRYCLALRRYVQYDCRQECDNFQQETEQIQTKDEQRGLLQNILH